MTTGTAHKIRTLEAAVAWREAQPGLVVFTNGVFDRIHLGHIALLKAARQAGDALIVAINSDDSARRLAKGPDRPMVPELDRAREVADFDVVDCVVLFGENTPLDLIRLLRPDVLVKGGDYTRDTVVGATEVEARGGRVTIIPLEPGFSTTAIVERLRDPS